MTTVLVFIYSGSPAQLACGAMICFLFLLLNIAFSPYCTDSLNSLASFTLVAQFLTLFVGIMVVLVRAQGEDQSAVGSSETGNLGGRGWSDGFLCRRHQAKYVFVNGCFVYVHMSEAGGQSHDKHEMWSRKTSMTSALTGWVRCHLSAAVVSFLIVFVNCLTIAWPIVRKVASGKIQSYYEAIVLILSNVKKYLCRYKVDMESERQAQRKKWENSSFRKQARWREGQSRSWQRTSDVARIRTPTDSDGLRIPDQLDSGKATQSQDCVANVLELEESLSNNILLKDATKQELSQIEVQPDEPLIISRGGVTDERHQTGSVPSVSAATKAEVFVMPLHEGADRLEPLMADAGMPQIINASVVNASPVSQPDIAFFAGARIQNVAASTQERETGHKANPWIQAARELEWSVDVEGGSARGVC